MNILKHRESENTAASRSLTPSIALRLFFLFTGASLFFYQPYLASAQDVPAPFVGNTLSGSPCAGKATGVGPYDYLRRGDPFIADRISVVEAHFSKEVEMLQHYNTIGNLDYTLRAVPNHHRALMSQARLDIHSPTRKYGNIDTYIPPECWYQRAIYFSPQDTTVKLQFGIFLHQHKLLDKAEALYLAALSADPNNPQIHYNLGLLYLDKGNLDEALEHANKAYKAGHPLPGLKRRLASEGVSISVE